MLASLNCGGTGRALSGQGHMVRDWRHSGRVAAMIVLMVVVNAFPLWYMSTHKGEPLFVGYTPELWGPVVAAIALVWVARVPEDRRAWTLALLALGGMQLLGAYLLDNVVNFGMDARPLLERALPMLAWFALLIAVNPLTRWLHREAETAEAYMARAASAAGMMLASVALAGGAALVLTASSLARRWLLDDSVLITVVGYGGMVAAIGLSDPIARALHLRPVREPGAIAQVQTVVDLEVSRQLAHLARVRNGTLFVGTYFVLGLTTVIHMWCGRQAEPFVAIGMMLGLLLPLIASVAAARHIKRAWQARIQTAGLGVAAFRQAAAQTELAFPEAKA